MITKSIIFDIKDQKFSMLQTKVVPKTKNIDLEFLNTYRMDTLTDRYINIIDLNQSTLDCCTNYYYDYSSQNSNHHSIYRVF